MHTSFQFEAEVDEMKWKYSSIGLRSLAAGLETTGRAKEILERCTPETRAALLSPMSESWHDGSIIVDVSLAIQQLLGDETVSEVYYQAIKRSLGPVMEPFLKIMLTIGGNKPQAVFSRLDSSLTTVMKGVHVTWVERPPRGGVVTVLHEDEVKPVSFDAWAGSLRYTFDLVGVAGGRVAPRRPSSDNKEFVFDVSW